MMPSLPYNLFICHSHPHHHHQFVAHTGAALALKSDKDCDLKQAIDKCIKSDFLVESADKKFKNLPKNANEMNTVCENVKKAEECSKDFIDKCAENDKEKRALDHSLDGMVRVVKRVCKTDAKKNGECPAR